MTMGTEVTLCLSCEAEDDEGGREVRREEEAGLRVPVEREVIADWSSDSVSMSFAALMVTR